MKTLKDMGKDRRVKLSEQDTALIKFFYHKVGMTISEITNKFCVSHQRISQIIDIMGTMEKYRKEQAKIHKYWYRYNRVYREQFLAKKKDYRDYKLKILAKYGKE